MKYQSVEEIVSMYPHGHTIFTYPLGKFYLNNFNEPSYDPAQKNRVVNLFTIIVHDKENKFVGEHTGFTEKSNNE